MARALTADEREAYAGDGFVVLRGVFSQEELEAARPGVDPRDRTLFERDPVLTQKVCFGNAGTGEDPTKVSKLEGLRGVKQFAPLFALCSDVRIAGVATQLLGPSAELMKDKYIFKAAGQGMPFSPHQDMQYIYHRVVTDAINFYIAFDDATADNGALQVVHGLERRLRGKIIADPTEQPICDELAALLTFRSVQLRRGDVLAFSGWVPHRSAPNNSQRDRAVYYPTYGLWSGPQGGLYEHYYRAYWRWLRAKAPSNKDGAVDDLFAAFGDPRPSLVQEHGVDLAQLLAES